MQELLRKGLPAQTMRKHPADEPSIRKGSVRCEVSKLLYQKVRSQLRQRPGGGREQGGAARPQMVEMLVERFRRIGKPVAPPSSHDTDWVRGGEMPLDELRPLGARFDSQRQKHPRPSRIGEPSSPVTALLAVHGRTPVAVCVSLHMASGLEGPGIRYKSRPAREPFAVETPSSQAQNGEVMTGFPYENTLTTNSTHQQLVAVGGSFASGTVISPSRLEEGSTGYDVKHEGAKQLEYQYKRPVTTVEKRDVTGGLELDGFAFPFDGDQGRTLWVRNQIPDAAYYVLPLVETDGQLRDILDHLVFVDVFGVMLAKTRTARPWSDFSRVYVDEAGSRVFLKLSDVDWRDPVAYREVEDRFVYRWPTFRERITRCKAGLPLRLGGERTREWKAKQRLDTALNTLAERLPFGGHPVEGTDEMEREGTGEVVAASDALREAGKDRVTDLHDALTWSDFDAMADREVRAAVEAAESPSDVVAEGAMDIIFESGDEAPRQSLRG